MVVYHANRSTYYELRKKEALEKAVKERTRELKQINKELSFQYKEKAKTTLKNTNLELIAAQESLKKSNSKLEETVKERTRALEKSNKDLHRINADLDNFI